MTQSTRLSRALKSAACAGVLGLLVSGAKASLLTLDVVATSGSNGATVVDGKDVVLSPSGGTVNYNIMAIVHGTDATQTNDGLNFAFLSIVGGSGNTGTFAGANVAPFNWTVPPASPGTPMPNSLGPDRAGVANSDSADSFQAWSNTGSPIMGTAATPGDTSFLIGTGTVSYGSGGTTTISIVPHIDTNNFAAGQHFQFVVDGTTYSLNGNGAGKSTLSDGTPGPNLTASSGAINEGAPINVVTTPEPGSLALIGLGSLGLLMRRRRA